MIEAASAVHLDALAALEAECFGADAWSRTQVADELAAPTRTVLVAIDGGSVVGYASLLVVADVAELVRIAVDARHRRHGWGSALLGRVVSDAARDGAAQLLLEVAADNQPAVTMYGRQGFTRTSVRRGYFHGGTDAVVMRRQLVPERTV